MAEVNGQWSCTVDSPMGTQEFVLTVERQEDGFTGIAEGGLGRQEITDGSLDDDTLRWTMKIKKPMPMSLSCEATVTGDTLAGQLKAGIFGRFPLTGQRA